jgi:tRNA A37 threonylcarbamoyladenosine modification protein TsaB
VLAVLDAGRGDIYAGEYDIDTSGAHFVSERLLSRSQLIESSSGSTFLAGDENLVGVARDAGLPVEEIELPRGDVIARLGWQKIQAGDTVSPEELEANYLRRSGEIFSKSSS